MSWNELELDDGNVVRFHLLGYGKQRCADVAAEPDAAARMLQNFRDERRCGRFAVGAGDGDDLTGADLEKDLHLRRDGCAGLAQLPQGRDVRVHAGRAEDDVGGDAIQIVRADVELRAELFQLQHLGVERVARRLVAGERLDAAREEHTDQRAVAHADAEHGDALAGQSIKIGVYRCVHDQSLDS